MLNQGISGVNLHKREESVAPDEYLPDDEDEEITEDENEPADEEEDEIEEEPDDEAAELMEDPTKTAGDKKQDDDEGKYFSR
jgi:hypothetical protein